ncbi:helix-turn-helix domain-containing protein [Lactiplantibacillus daowaiensis]|uniref:Helix-turn-helix domain-containing protein n=1 Tax=Lactiplantibacillus daowaiensis TaxID=2559918 RepID=A0ABW1RXW5_9LACO|nr:helix-turn-helix transcriptional regulator [Lactiplantibacillus daowaiensis]
MNNLQKIRHSKNLTQQDAAKAIGISYSTLTKVENGYRGASKETMEKFSNFYDKSVDYLFFSNSITESERKEVAK